MRLFIFLVFVFLLGCATGISGLVRLQDRELLIHPDKPYLSFPYHKTVCTPRRWRWLPKKCHTEQAFIDYDMNKKEDRKTLIDSGFSCKSKMRFKY